MDAITELLGTEGAAGRKDVRERVVSECLGKVRAHVRCVLSRRPDLWAEAQQAGVVGLLLALDRYDDTIAGPDRGKKDFWGYAFPRVRHEVQSWIGVGVHWRKPTNRGTSPARRAAYAEAARHLHHLSMDAVTTSQSDGEPVSLHDVSADPAMSVEESVAMAEGLARLEEFMSKLNAEQKATLLGKTRASRHYSELIGAAKAYLAKEPGRDDAREQTDIRSRGLAERRNSGFQRRVVG